MSHRGDDQFDGRAASLQPGSNPVVISSNSDFDGRPVVAALPLGSEPGIASASSGDTETRASPAQ
jgi:hypothetical protein